MVPSKVRIIQYLAEPTAATLMGYGYALQQNLEEATKKTKTTAFRRMCWCEVHALFLGLPQFL